MQTIKYYLRSDQYSFGKNRAYVVGDAAKYIGMLTGKSSLNLDDIRALQALGLSVKKVEHVSDCK